MDTIRRELGDGVWASTLAWAAAVAVIAAVVAYAALSSAWSA